MGSEMCIRDSVNVVQMIDTPVYKNYQEELKYLTTNQKRLEYIAKLIEKIRGWAIHLF